MYEISHKQKSMFFATLSFVFVTGGALILPTTKQHVGIWIGIGCEILGTICALASVIEHKKELIKKMKPSSKNEVMNGIVNAYIAQKALDKANNTHYADTWKILNGADDEIDASLTFDLSEGEWDSVKKYLKKNKISFALCLVSYKDGHSQNSFVWYDDEHIYAVEMNEIGSVSFHMVDNANKETIKPTDESSSSILKMLLALENGGANGGGGEVTTKQVFKGGVEILDKPLDVESKATFGNDVDVDGALTINSASDLKTKDGTVFEDTIPTLAVVRNESDDTLYFTQESLTIIKKRMQTKTPIGKFSLEFTEGVALDCVAYEMVHVPKVEGFMEESVIFPLFFNLEGINVYSVNVVDLTTGKITTSTFNNYTGFALANNSLSLGDDTFTGYTTSLQINTINGTPTIQKETSQDIKVQSTLYRHTITIYEGSTKDKNSICFTTYTPSNTPIDSIQDLTASADGSNKLANTDLECFGVSGTASALTFYNKIHVGTSISNTTLQKATGGTATLASVYSSYTMTDDVTLN